MEVISTAYEPGTVEPKWYRNWIRDKDFHAKIRSPKPGYAIVIPPPNVTGVLTMGHVLNNALQDILIRRARLEGRGALWIPGTDHAGIATQTVVERELRKTKVHRRDQGRAPERELQAFPRVPSRRPGRRPKGPAAALKHHVRHKAPPEAATGALAPFGLTITISGSRRSIRARRRPRTPILLSSRSSRCSAASSPLSGNRITAPSNS